jgi:hypothetical protein
MSLHNALRAVCAFDGHGVVDGAAKQSNSDANGAMVVELEATVTKITALRFA